MCALYLRCVLTNDEIYLKRNLNEQCTRRIFVHIRLRKKNFSCLPRSAAIEIYVDASIWCATFHFYKTFIFYISKCEYVRYPLYQCTSIHVHNRRIETHTLITQYRMKILWGLIIVLYGVFYEFHFFFFRFARFLFIFALYTSTTDGTHPYRLTTLNNNNNNNINGSSNTYHWYISVAKQQMWRYSINIATLV